MLSQAKALAYRVLAVPAARRGYERTTQLVLSVGGSSRIASHLYHTVFPLSFNREQYAVLRGRSHYYRRSGVQHRSSVALRRNIHRLEKGLLMRPPRPLFAVDYILETVERYESVVDAHTDGDDLDRDELRWATDVLTAYFERTDGQTAVDAARGRFDAARGRFDEATPGRRVPYKRAQSPEMPVVYDDLLQLAMRRRSVRWFLPRPVDRALIDKALEVARQSPTACNRSPYEFRVFDDPELVRQVADVPFGSAGYAHNIPVLAVLIGRLDSFFSPRDRHLIYIDTSLAAMGFMYGLETVGLGSSVINWPDFEPLERKMQALLGLEVHERPIMLIALGHPDPEGEVAYSQKKELDSFRFFNPPLRGGSVGG